MTGCGRMFCPHCDEEMIHRDHRKGYESASALGQIIWREGPGRLSVTDLDLASRKGLPSGQQLLRLLEQKQPGHKFGISQERTLKLLDSLILHAIACPEAASLQLDPRSGVYVLRGEVAAAQEWPRQTMLCGVQEVERLTTGGQFKFETHEQLFEFLDPEEWHIRRRPAYTDRQLPEIYEPPGS